VVGWSGFKVFRLTYKWVGLGWFTKWPTRGGSGRAGSSGPFWQLYLGEC